MVAMRIKGPGAMLGLAALAAVMAGPAAAQATLSFNLGLRLESDSNVDLTAASKQPRHGAQLRFGMDYLSETEVSKLALSANGALGAYGGRGAETGRGLVTPQVRLRYDRGVRATDLFAEASYRESNLSELDPASQDLASGGKQRVGRLAAGVNWRKDAPLGFGLRASTEDTSFVDAPGRIDRRRDRFGGHIRADLSEVLSAKLDLGRSHYRPETGAERRTTTGRLSFELQRPTSLWRLSTGIDDTPDGSRERISIGQVIERPLGEISWSLGLVRGINGKTSGTADLGWAHEIENGVIEVTASRDVTSNDDTDRETVENRLAVNLRKQVTQRGGFHLGAAWSETRYASPDNKISGLTLSAVWSQELTEDWALDMGYTHRQRSTDFSPTRQSDRIHLELRRAFAVKF